MPRLSEMCRFLRALIGQLSSALWLAEYLKREMEMLHHNTVLWCRVPAWQQLKTIKPITNEALVASSRDIITD